MNEEIRDEDQQIYSGANIGYFETSSGRDIGS
jgi:hypothetical protein